MIDFTINKEVLRSNIREARKHGIILPTIAQQKDPSLVPPEICERLKGVGMQDFSPLNLFRKYYASHALCCELCCSTRQLRVSEYLQNH